MAHLIMIQGTMSGAGKSLLTAGLLRIFKEDGYRVAPFKSQNMALNSYITKDGLEIGRAQAVQAEAAGIEPTVYMNPILLKPTNDIGSQVIVNGEVIGNMKARDYFAFKKELIPEILHAFHELEKEYDIIVIEGAGSPAEINLKQQDIVNMGLARMLHAPVLLAGDIDRGGVFAQLYGTTELLEPEEKGQIKGLIINKFRGDKSILDPGIDMLEEKVGIPVVGTIPYLHVDIEEEDSLSERLQWKREGNLLEIVVVRFPRISNYTDFAPLEHLNGVNVRYAAKPEELDHADLIILPGSKNTMGDLRWMRESGMEVKVQKKTAEQIPVIGICGGFQMMGGRLLDPEGAEEGGEMRGLGILPMDTVFSVRKTRTQTTGIMPELVGYYENLSSAVYEGYEIHMGQTEIVDNAAPKSLAMWKNNETGQCIGMADGNILGTYIHGFFDREEITTALLEKLAARKGISLENDGSRNYKAYKEGQYRLLAQGIRENLDMKKIYEILEQGEEYDGTIRTGAGAAR